MHSAELCARRADICNAGRSTVRLPALQGSVRAGVLGQKPEQHYHPCSEGKHLVTSATRRIARRGFPMTSDDHKSES